MAGWPFTGEAAPLILSIVSLLSPEGYLRSRTKLCKIKGEKQGGLAAWLMMNA